MEKRIWTLFFSLILVFTLVAEVPAQAKGVAGSVSNWAQAEIEAARQNNLIPEYFNNQDLRSGITRAEFAAVAVRLYEVLSGQQVQPVNAPLQDIYGHRLQEEIEKAYALNIATGNSATTFAPDNLLTRQEMATMLCRVVKKQMYPDWTLASDQQYRLEYTMPGQFADNGLIATWAAAGVYYMAANSVINGVGNNNFAPTKTATREQAIIIANRITGMAGIRKANHAWVLIKTESTHAEKGYQDNIARTNRYRYEYDDDRRVLTHYNYYTWDYLKEKAQDTLVFRTNYPPIRIPAKQRLYMDISAEIVDAVGVQKWMNGGLFSLYGRSEDIGWSQHFYDEKLEGNYPYGYARAYANEGKAESARVYADIPEGKKIGDIMTIHATTNTSAATDVETIWTYRWE